jgi:hypothetical protein
VAEILGLIEDQIEPAESVGSRKYELHLTITEWRTRFGGDGAAY